MNARARDALHAMVLITLCVGPARADEQEQVWSQAVAGLSCRLVVTNGQVPQGAEVPFQLQLRYEPGPDAPAGVTLVRFVEARGVRITLTDEVSGKTFLRVPEDGSYGMLVMRHKGDLIPLGVKPLAPVRVPVRLLTRKAEQLPAGRYTVVAVYGNAGVYEHAGLGEDARLPQKSKFWEGRLVSPPLRLHVLPAKPRVEEHEVPTRIVVGRDAWGIGFSTAAKPLARIRFQLRPGYMVGARTRDRVLVGRDKPQDIGNGLGGLPGPDTRRSWLPVEMVKRVVAGERLKFWSDLEVFETSVPSGHFWTPTGPGYKTLWTGRLEGALVAGERAGWDRPVRGLRCVVKVHSKVHVRGRPFLVTLRLETSSDAQVDLWSAIHRESLVTLGPDGSFHEIRLTNEPERNREKPLVVAKGNPYTVTKDVSSLLDAAAAKGGCKLRIVWHAWLVCGHRDDGSTLHVSNAAEVDVRAARER